MDNTNENLIGVMRQVNAVEGFDPSAYIKDTNGKPELPLMVRVGWFRLKYPEGRLCVNVEAQADCFTARAIVYKDYNDAVEHSLADVSVSFDFDPAHDDRNAMRKKTQVEAASTALELAGFGVYFAAGEPLPDAEGLASKQSQHKQAAPQPTSSTEHAEASCTQDESEDAVLKKAMALPCPITRHEGKTLGDLIVADPRALAWLSKRTDGDPEVNRAAKVICEYALTQTA